MQFFFRKVDIWLKFYEEKKKMKINYTADESFEVIFFAKTSSVSGRNDPRSIFKFGFQLSLEKGIMWLQWHSLHYFLFLFCFMYCQR